MADIKGAVLSATRKINIRSASIGNYYERNKKRITQAGAKFLELSETAKQRDDWKGRLELWKQDTLIIANESVDKLKVQLDKLGNDTFQVESNDSPFEMEIAHPFIRDLLQQIRLSNPFLLQLFLLNKQGLL